MDPVPIPATPPPAAGSAPRAAYARFRETVAPHGAEHGYTAADVLARQAQAGDLAARDRLYAGLQSDLLRQVAPLLRPGAAGPSGRVEADDLRQELFLIFCDLLRDWQPARAPFRGYLGAVLPHRLRHCARRLRRAREVGVAPAAAAADGPPNGPPDGAEPADLPFWERMPAPEPVATGIESADLRAALAGLPPGVRRLVLLYVLDGRPMPEVAAAQNVTTRQAWRIYHAALRSLRAALDEAAARVAAGADLV